jgi:uncharacterized protein (DUF1697 family)
MPTHLALLRGVNVSGHRKVPMAELRELCAELGFAQVRTHIQSGNVVFEAAGGSTVIGSRLEEALERRFGFSVDVVIRSRRQWSHYLETNPFRAAARKDPGHVLLGLGKRRPRAGTAEALLERAAAGERVEAAGDALWFHYPKGIGRSKLAPALIDRLAGTPVTARNWRTVLALAELAGQDA